MRARPLAALLLLAACAPSAPRPGEARRIAEHITVQQLAPGVWLHVTEGISGDEWYPANGMLVATDSGGLLVDAGWDDAQAAALLAWAAEIGQPVRRAVVTHFHEDRTGGVAALRRAGVRVLGHPLTVTLAAREGHPGVEAIPGVEAGPVRVGGVEVYYPGAGHAPDNVVVYAPGQRILFGGCLVKADTATEVGNVSDADVPGWPGTVARVRQRYADVRIVIPGHGGFSGPAALTNTERVIAEKGPAAVEAYRRSRR